MKVQKTGSAGDQSDDSVAQGDAASNETPAPVEMQATNDQSGDIPASDAPAAPTIALEQPSAGGSYIRQADGTLVKQEG